MRAWSRKVVIVRFPDIKKPDTTASRARNSLKCIIVRQALALQSEGAVTDRLLVVDDDAEKRRAYETHFRRAGFEVEGASSLREAADRLAAGTFQAVIADVSLTPSVGNEGLAIAAYLRHLNRHPTPVMVLTAYGEPDKATAAARLDVDAFLHKPVSLVWLEGLLRSRIDERRGGGDGADPGLEPVAAAI
jgi:two-component system response regulator PilR (NtrC family)